MYSGTSSARITLVTLPAPVVSKSLVILKAAKPSPARTRIAGGFARFPVEPKRLMIPANSSSKVPHLASKFHACMLSNCAVQLGQLFAQVSRQSFTWYRPVFDLSWHQAATWPKATLQSHRYEELRSDRSPQLISPHCFCQVHWHRTLLRFWTV